MKWPQGGGIPQLASEMSLGNHERIETAKEANVIRPVSLASEKENQSLQPGSVIMSCGSDRFIMCCCKHTPNGG